ncbi:glutathione S-transferase-like protein [Mycena pura]|uniref:glutathione transferase n=1 Tax=Mycena pura TaxID=153505 RepID=A0AAD6VG21_9AGAR|nr:glutathione S-transferase-like protein [Mycena pura]
MPLKIYGFRASSCTRRVALICKELQVPYEIVQVDLTKGEQRSPAHLVRQPFGLIPAVEDDGFELFESRAICRYLVAKYGKVPGDLVPDHTDIIATAKFEQAVSIENNNFDPTAGQIMLELVMKPARGLAIDKERAESLISTINSKLDAYETILSKQKYLAGDSVTIADLFHLPWAYGIVEKAKLDVISKRPSVARWYEDISSRPSWQAVKDGA